MEMAAHDPRPYGVEGVLYAATVTGGRHTEGLTRGSDDAGVPALGIPKSDHRIIEHKGRVAKIVQDWSCMINTMGWCLFTDGHYDEGGRQINFMRVYNAVTGLNIGVQDGLLIGERIVNLRKAFNMRHGCTRAEDTLPREASQGTQCERWRSCGKVG